MCGIAGIFHSENITPAQIRAVTQELHSRGPDGSGLNLFSFSSQGWHSSQEGPAALIQTRLSIRDVSSAGAQPMKNEDGSIWIVYNGEIYGWEQKAQELRQRGHHFIGNSDTEFILHGYEEWGDGILQHLQGMFAFSIFDLRKERLFLARDRLGEKPLFYTMQEGSFAFASTSRALSVLVNSEKKPCFDSKAIDAFLTHRYIPAPLSIIDGFQKLPAAHALIIDLKNGEQHINDLYEYWTPQSNSLEDPATCFQKAIELRLASDRPLGIFLSGGIDSQAIAATISDHEMMPQLRAFTATFPDHHSYDESITASKIANRLGLPHTKLPIVMKVEDIDSIIHDLDEPFADPSAIPTWYLCKAAAKNIVVALAGDGGDELFAGYKRYQVHQRAARLLPRLGLYSSAWHSSSLCLKTSHGGKLRRALLGYQLGWEDAYALRFSALDPLSRAFLQPDIDIQTNYWRLPSEKLSARDWMLECDRLNYLPEYILRKSDLCGMAHGLELRAPMLDHRFFESVQKMSDKERFTNPSKQFLQNQIGSNAILGPKRGFNPPLHAWLHEEKLSWIYNELPKTLETLTGGQLSASRLTTFFKEAKNDPRLDELSWMFIVLAFSLKTFV